MYHGAATIHAEVKEAFESSDLVISIGHFPSDTNMGGFSSKFPENFIVCHPDYLSIGGKKHEISFVPVVRKLVAKLKAAGTQEPKQAAWWKLVCLALHKLMRVHASLADAFCLLGYSKSQLSKNHLYRHRALSARLTFGTSSARSFGMAIP